MTDHRGVPEHLRPHAILIEAPDMPGYDELPETLAERQALPPRFHVPVWDDTLTKPVWLCAVCWDEGETSMWPCATAAKNGREVFAMGTELARYKAALHD